MVALRFDRPISDATRDKVITFWLKKAACDKTLPLQIINTYMGEKPGEIIQAFPNNVRIGILITEDRDFVYLTYPSGATTRIPIQTFYAHIT